MTNINPPISMGGYDLAFIDASKRYGNGAQAVAVLCGDKSPALCASVNIPNEAHRLDEGEFFLKDWNENELPIAALIERGIIEIVATKPPAESGFITAKVARLKA